MPVRVTTTIPAAVRRVNGWGTELPIAVEMTMLEAGYAARDILISAVKEKTPRSKNRPAGAAQKSLAETTVGTVVVDGPRVRITANQTKTIPIHGEQYSLAKLLTDGRRGGYVVSPLRPAFALFWAGIRDGHPVGRSHPGAAKPIPYLADAREAARPAIRALMREAVNTRVRSWMGAVKA